MEEVLLVSLQHLIIIEEQYQSPQYHKYRCEMFHDCFANFNSCVFREFFGIIGLFSYFKEVKQIYIIVWEMGSVLFFLADLDCFEFSLDLSGKGIVRIL